MWLNIFHISYIEKSTTTVIKNKLNLDYFELTRNVVYIIHNI